MASFQAKVEDYVGTISDTLSITEWCTSGARFIIDLLPERILKDFATTVSVSTSGLATATYRIWQALKNGYEAKRVSTGLYSAVQDENSLYYAINASPVSVVYNGKIYIFPNGGEILAMTYPTVGYSAESISNFPTRLEHGVVLYAAIQAAVRKAMESLTSVSSLTAPTAPSAPSFSFTSTTGEVVELPELAGYTKPTTTFSITNLETYISTEEDLEKASLEVQHQKTLLEKFQMDLYNELNETNAQIEVYRSTLQKYIEDARLAQEAGLLNSTKELEASIAEYQSQLNKYQSEIQAYANQIGANVNLAQGYYSLADKLKVEFNEYVQGIIR